MVRRSAIVVAVLCLAGAPALVLGGESAPAAPKPAKAAKAAKAAPAAAKPIPVVTLALHVAKENGKQVVDDAWIDSQIHEAQHQFEANGIAFRKGKVVDLASKHAALETRKDRDVLRSQLDKGVINVFFVRLLRDVDEPPREIHGVHWRPQNDKDKRYVIVSSIAGPTTLAHEIGHFFGLPHSKTKNNLMSYDRSSGKPPFLDASQEKIIGQYARAAFRTKELLPPESF